MKNNSILGIRIGTESISQILKKVAEFSQQSKHKVFHITNLNPDIFSLAHKNNQLKQIINNSDSIVVDGIGIKIASSLFKIKSGERMTGTDLMLKLIEFAAKNDKKILLLGGQDNSAQLAQINLKKKFKKIKIKFDPGAKNIKTENRNEKMRILNKINSFKPDFLFIAYGPPQQELWINSHRKDLKGVVCMGVGGSFNFYANISLRAPQSISRLGLEWLWRFIFEPHRLMTKLPNHLNYIWLILKNYLKR